MKTLLKLIVMVALTILMLSLTKCTNERESEIKKDIAEAELISTDSEPVTTF